MGRPGAVLEGETHEEVIGPRASPCPQRAMSHARAARSERRTIRVQDRALLSAAISLGRTLSALCDTPAQYGSFTTYVLVASYP
jgi:hypothetical protein